MQSPNSASCTTNFEEADRGEESLVQIARVGRKLRLTPDVQGTIVASIRDGSFAWVAARAAGIGESTFYRWLDLGEQGIEPFREFREQVETAHAEARSSAEAEVRRTNPLAWLRFGPGRERTGRPGWTEDRQQVQVDVGVGVQVGVSAGAFTDEEQEAMWRAVYMLRHGTDLPTIVRTPVLHDAVVEG